MSLVLDTNVLLCWVRNDTTWHYLRDEYDLAGDAAKPIVSAVSIGEILALAHRNDWGAKKRDDLERVIAALRVIEVDYSEILDLYAELDKFSNSSSRKRSGGGRQSVSERTTSGLPLPPWLRRPPCSRPTMILTTSTGCTSR